MTEDAERLDDIGEEEETSEPDAEVEEPVVKEEKKEKEEKTPRGNPLGILFNIRMFRRFIQIGFFVAINAYILLAWFRMPNVQAFFISIRDALPTLPILSPLDAPFVAIAGVEIDKSISRLIAHEFFGKLPGLGRRKHQA